MRREDAPRAHGLEGRFQLPRQAEGNQLRHGQQRARPERIAQVDVHERAVAAQQKVVQMAVAQTDDNVQDHTAPIAEQDRRHTSPPGNTRRSAASRGTPPTRQTASPDASSGRPTSRPAPCARRTRAWDASCGLALSLFFVKLLLALSGAPNSISSLERCARIHKASPFVLSPIPNSLSNIDLTGGDAGTHSTRPTRGDSGATAYVRSAANAAAPLGLESHRNGLE